MSVAIVDASGNLDVCFVSQAPVHGEGNVMPASVGEIIRQQGNVRFLVLAEHFLGWEQGGDWGDVSFQKQYDPYIKQIAIVGARQWEELVLVFVGQGIRQVASEYFQPADLAQARAWLTI